MKVRISLTFLTAMMVLLISTGAVGARRVQSESSSPSPAHAFSTSASLGSTFTYQGYLSDDGGSANDQLGAAPTRP